VRARARVHLTDCSGASCQEVLAIGETAQRHRLQTWTETRLAGRSRWLKRGATALVPKHAVTLLKPLKQEAPMS
jgi:hypothetical protein